MKNRLILTLSCGDRPGLVAAVAGSLFERGANIVEAQQFDDPETDQFFMRIVFDGEEWRLSEEAFLHDFAGDLPKAKARVLYAVQGPFHRALLTGRTERAAWQSKPTYYVVSTEDRTIEPDLERVMAKRMGAKTIELEAGHLSLIAHPAEITALILEAAGRQTGARYP